MGPLAVIAAAFFTTLAVRKLPGFRTLYERGIKPVACDVCMSAWVSLLWRLGDLPGCWLWSWEDWYAFVGNTAALAGGTLVLLSAYRWAQARLGLPEFEAGGQYEPPAGGTDGA